MDRAADLVTEDRVDEPVLLDPRQPRELLGGDRRTEVVTTACPVLDLGDSPGDGGLDPAANVVHKRHLDAQSTATLDER